LNKKQNQIAIENLENESKDGDQSLFEGELAEFKEHQKT
jgi:hypothetical protein